MTKRAKATTTNEPMVLDAVVFEYLRQERSPEDAGKKAGVEAFEGLGANILAFVHQRMAQQTCVE